MATMKCFFFQFALVLLGVIYQAMGMCSCVPVDFGSVIADIYSKKVKLIFQPFTLSAVRLYCTYIQSRFGPINLVSEAPCAPLRSACR